MAESTTAQPVLILGAGIHGAAIARELLLNGLSVVLVDAADVASGATSKSSRLIHGGLRYLEFGDIGLVQESLRERRYHLEHVSHFVQPLRLYIPLKESWSGLIPAAVGFLGGRQFSPGKWLPQTSTSRGYWPVRLGLSMYDWLAGESLLPGSSSVPLNDPAAPRIDPARYRSLVAYSDAQMLYPERVVLALVAEAQAIATAAHLSFTVATYARLNWNTRICRVESPLLAAPYEFQPALVINASGAAGDLTLSRLGVTSLPHFGGTKGSHILTWHPGLREALKGHAVYAEAPDGRPVFVLPFADGVLIGTTDEYWEGPPEEAVATEAEINYLIEMVAGVFGIVLSREDIAAHYSGVRPLPRHPTGTNAAISRDHSLATDHREGCPVITLVGGKLTTWRAFAEEATNLALGTLGRLRYADTRRRSVWGNEPLEGRSHADLQLFQQWALEFQSTPEEVATLWRLFGTRLTHVLQDVADEPREPLADTTLSTRIARWIIRHEHVQGLADLVERRLMTVLGPELSVSHLEQLARCLVEEGRLNLEDIPTAVEQTRLRLQRYYGRRF